MKFSIYQFLRSKVKSKYIVEDILQKVKNYNFDDFMKKRSKTFDRNCYMIEYYCDNIEHNECSHINGDKLYKLREYILNQIVKYDLTYYENKIYNNYNKIYKIYINRVCCDIEDYISGRINETFKSTRHKKYHTEASFIYNIFNFIDQLLF